MGKINKRLLTQGTIAAFLLLGAFATVALWVSRAYSRTSSRAPYTSPQLQRVVIESQALRKPMRANVYLPKDFRSDVRYPVLYLLHGLADDEDEWLSDLRVGERAD